MSLEDEILINQFGQGVRSSADVLDQFNQLDTDGQRHHFLSMYCDLARSPWSESDTRLALTDCSLADPDAMYAYLNLYRLIGGPKRRILVPDSSNPLDGQLDRAYEVLLALFKIGYQRRFALEQSNSSAWQYWDLSDPEVEQRILAQHQDLVGHVYTDPGYRSEFVCLAKSWRDDKLARQQQALEPVDKPQNSFNFVTYDEMVDEFIMQFNEKSAYALRHLRYSLAQALIKQYKLSQNQGDQLVTDVIERHLLDTYNMTFL